MSGEYGITEASEISSWDEEADVVIVGMGSAGSCAAIEAAEAGASVLALDRASGAGGTTANAAGHFYLGGGTRVQKAVGIEDDVEDMYRYLIDNTPEPDAGEDPPLLRRERRALRLARCERCAVQRLDPQGEETSSR